MVQSWLKLCALGGLGLLLAGCSHHRASSSNHHGFASAKADPFAGNGSAYYKGSGAIPFGGGKYFVGKPYSVAGRWFTPKEQPGYQREGTASWYGEAFHRRKTSNGEYFDMNTFTAAHATLPLPSYALVTNLENNRQVVVRINDRGPFVGTRVIDLSKRAADTLGYRKKGTAHVRVKLIGPAPKQDSMSHMVAMNNAMRNGASMGQLVAMSGDTSARATTQVASNDDPQDGGSYSQQAMNDPATQQYGADPYASDQQVAMDAPKSRKKIVQQVAQDFNGTDDQGNLQPAAFAAPPAPMRSYVVRVAVFHDLANAKTAFEQLSDAGPTRIVKAVGANGPLYRVEVGPLNSKADADAAMTAVQGAGYEDAKAVAAEPQQISMN
ncbi:septal ring lytic transglycosylase RlpA family protein [Aestuariivirga litoralis]|uniref:septal ring lytic transglycosylase RlpA family protein n=1 Tax=Aestuariivirga litoralis TaxID=2650924 RepID=UPI0018C66DD1|nr:septal ring lytic transglycosylase RlpA family protein [Aestuariivirga litoralis]MBG1231544.1 septal ring lytic transglycosylase RlpA family protein [Aestuariivirga litoralis]